MTLQVACAATGDYVPHAATMLKSVLLGAPRTPMQVHFLHDEALREDDRRLLQEMLEQGGATVNFLEAKSLLPDAMPRLLRYTPAAYFRLLLPRLLQGIERVLYLDSDLVAVDSLLPLWEWDLRDKAIGAIADASPRVAERARALGLPSEAAYFNSGVLLMDLARMRREQLAEQVIAFARENRQRIVFPDQDPLNAVLCEHRAEIPLRYNVQAAVYDRILRKMVALPEVFVQEARANPAIVHFSSHWKPWHYRCKHPLRHLYHEYRRQTPWKECALEGITWKNRFKRIFPEEWPVALSELRAGRNPF